MKKYLSLLFLLALLSLILISCSGGDTIITSEATTGNETTSEDILDESTTDTATETPEPITLKSIKIDGVDISEYTIVYAKSVFESYKDNITTEYDFDRISAEKLQQLIKDYIGVELPIAKDTDKKSDKYEILVGRTTRNLLSVSNVATYKYQIEASDGRLSFLGGTYGVTYHCIDYFKDYLDGFIKSRNENVDIKSGFRKTGTHKLTTVACVGDSITQGVGASNATIYSYPAVLQRILWKDFVVVNYGNSGKTLRTDLLSSSGAKESYQLTNEFKNCKNNIKNIDIVLIMLGTNDSNRVATVEKRDWNEADDKKYSDDYKLLLNIFYSQNKNLQFLIMNCPVYYGNQMFGSERVRELQLSLATKFKNDGLPVSFYDMHTFSKTKMGTTCFPDGLHPNDNGYAIMANALSREVKNLLSEK